MTSRDEDVVSHRCTGEEGADARHVGPALPPPGAEAEDVDGTKSLPGGGVPAPDHQQAAAHSCEAAEEGQAPLAVLRNWGEALPGVLFVEQADVVDRGLLGIGLGSGLKEAQEVRRGAGLLALLEEGGAVYEIPPLVADAHEERVRARGHAREDHQCDVVREGGNIWLLELTPPALSDAGGRHSHQLGSCKIQKSYLSNQYCAASTYCSLQRNHE